MQKLKRYDLKFELAREYFLACFKGVNVLSENLIDLDFSHGVFFTLLPSDVDVTKLLEFQWGGLTQSLRDEICDFIQKKLISNNNLSCIFDDFDSDYSTVDGNSLYRLCGLHLNNQIYYVASKENKTIDLVPKCMRYSDAVWHSLCVLTSAHLSDILYQNLSLSKIHEIIHNAEIIIVGAYDGEGYVFWERKNK